MDSRVQYVSVDWLIARNFPSQIPLFISTRRTPDSVSQRRKPFSVNQNEKKSTSVGK